LHEQQRAVRRGEVLGALDTGLIGLPDYFDYNLDPIRFPATRKAVFAD